MSLCGKRRLRRADVLCAHIDSKLNTPGALDNAAGVVTLLLLAELLADTMASSASRSSRSTARTTTPRRARGYTWSATGASSATLY